LWTNSLIETTWRKENYEIDIPEWIELINTIEIPDNINETWTDILKKAIVCEVSQRPFRITAMELEYYKKNWIPLPRKHPDIRFNERINMKHKYNWIKSNCIECKNELINYSWISNSLCKNCYQK
jgi:hypothetical protein